MHHSTESKPSCWEKLDDMYHGCRREIFMQRERIKRLTFQSIKKENLQNVGWPLIVQRGAETLYTETALAAPQALATYDADNPQPLGKCHLLSRMFCRRTNQKREAVLARRMQEVLDRARSIRTVPR